MTVPFLEEGREWEGTERAAGLLPVMTKASADPSGNGTGVAAACPRLAQGGWVSLSLL